MHYAGTYCAHDGIHGCIVECGQFMLGMCIADVVSYVVALIPSFDLDSFETEWWQRQVGFDVADADCQFDPLGPSDRL